MPSATWRTGFVCPKCGKEAKYETQGLFGGLLKSMAFKAVLDRLNREGGTLKTFACEHRFIIKPGSRLR